MKHERMSLESVEEMRKKHIGNLMVELAETGESWLSRGGREKKLTTTYTGRSPKRRRQSRRPDRWQPGQTALWQRSFASTSALNTASRNSIEERKMFGDWAEPSPACIRGRG